jgi:TFIIF-interacting CTD phosphatase-like protein
MTDKKQHIILDVDNTLIYTSYTHFKSADKINKPLFKIDMGGKDGFVYARPYLKEFLQHCFNTYNSVSIWSLGNKVYIKSILTGLKKHLKMDLKFDIIYTYEDTPEKYYSSEGIIMNIKDLNKIWDNHKDLGINKNNTIFIDDRSDVLRETPKNHIEVPKFIGQKNDTVLYKLIKYLNNIKDKTFITRVKKEDWLLKVIDKKKKSPKKIVI